MSVGLVAMVVILLMAASGLLRVLLGAHMVERMLAVQLLGTCLVAILMLAADVWQRPALVNATVLIALLSAVAMMAMASRDDSELFK